MGAFVSCANRFLLLLAIKWLVVLEMDQGGPQPPMSKKLFHRADNHAVTFLKSSNLKWLLSKSNREYLHPKINENILLSFLLAIKKRRTLIAPEMVAILKLQSHWISPFTKMLSYKESYTIVTVVIKNGAKVKQYAISGLSNTTGAKNILTQQANNYLWCWMWFFNFTPSASCLPWLSKMTERQKLQRP